MADKKPNAPTTPDSLAATPVLRLIALGLLIVGCFLVLRPFVSAILWAVVLCLSSWPVYCRLLQRLGGRRTWAALLMTLSILLILLGPFVLIGISLADDVRNLTAATQSLLQSPPADPPGWAVRLPLIGPRAGKLWREAAADSSTLRPKLGRFVEPVTSSLLTVSVQLAGGLADLAMSIFIAFFLFRDGPALANRLTAATQQIAGREARPLIDLAASTMRGVVYGVLGTALAQSVMAGIGLVLAGVPGAGLLALVTFFLSVTPVGAPLVWVPAAIWLFAKGSTGWGVFMIIWGVLISTVDNVIKPLIIRHGSPMPFLMILLGVLGGAVAFGFLGVFLGPTLLAVGLRLLEQWSLTRVGTGTEGR